MTIRSTSSHVGDNLSSRISSSPSFLERRCPSTTSISTPNLWPRRSIARRNRIVTPPQPGIICIVRAQESNKRSWLPTPTPSHLDLRTRQIHLRSAHTLRLVQRDGLDTHEILAGGRVLRDSERHCRFFWRAIRLLCRHTTTKQGGVR
jgi:hypothetical protein